jgi:hypothetical protein
LQRSKHFSRHLILRLKATGARGTANDHNTDASLVGKPSILKGIVAWARR